MLQYIKTILISALGAALLGWLIAGPVFAVIPIAAALACAGAGGIGALIICFIHFIVCLGYGR